MAANMILSWLSCNSYMSPYPPPPPKHNIGVQPCQKIITTNNHLNDHLKSPIQATCSTITYLLYMPVSIFFIGTSCKHSMGLNLRPHFPFILIQGGAVIWAKARWLFLYEKLFTSTWKKIKKPAKIPHKVF